MSEDSLKILCVKTNKGCFISDCLATSGYNYSYHRSQIENLYFDGVKPSPTFYTNWLFIEAYPQRVERKITGEPINERYIINDKKYASEAMPEVIPKKKRKDYSEAVMELYSYKCERKPDHFDEVDVEINVVMEVENFELPPKIQFETTQKWNYDTRPYTIKNVDVNHQIIDKMIFPEVMLHSRPSSFSSKQVYDITRQHVIDNINPAVAKITSNYDFCFEVKKIVPLTVPEKVTYQNIFARTKKERQKLHTSIKQYNDYPIFEMTSKQENYRGYTPIPEMTANSEKELNDKMNSWLERLMEEINKPLCECSNCGGRGFFINDTKVRADYESDHD